MPRWDHEIRIKELWAAEADDDDMQAIEVAPQVAERLRAFAKRIESKKPFLASEIENIADEFADVPETDKPERAFNDILDGLYDLADANRIWVA